MQGFLLFKSVAFLQLALIFVFKKRMYSLVHLNKS